MVNLVQNQNLEIGNWAKICCLYLQGQDVYSISVLSSEEKSPRCASELAFLSFLEVSKLSKNQMCLDAQLNCQNCIDLPVKSADPISPCIVDLNIEKEYSKTPEANDEAVESLKSESALTVSLIVQVPII